MLMSIGGFGLQAQVSVKGNWSSIEKETLIEELNSARASFETFLDSAHVDVMILCIADKIEARFENMDHMDGNSDDVERMTFTCLEEMGLINNQSLDTAASVKGQWNKRDIQQAYMNLEFSRKSMSQVIDSSSIDNLFDCVVEKLEQNYASFNEASNHMEEVSLLTSMCMEELELLTTSSTSTKGNWNDVDKAALNEQLEYLQPDLEKSAGNEGVTIVFDCIREKFEHSFDSYQEINNYPEIYKAILDECYGLVK